jgi:hypothetical protein
MRFRKAKSAYAARGRELVRRSDGPDLKESFRTEEGSFDLAAYKPCLNDND